MFYEHREQTPREWMRRVKESLTHISPAFDCRRMVHEYMTELYEPAHLGHLRMRKAQYALSREKTQLEFARPRSLGSRAFRRCRTGTRRQRGQRQAAVGTRRHRSRRADARRCARRSRDRPRRFQRPPGRYRSYGTAPRRAAGLRSPCLPRIFFRNGPEGLATHCALAPITMTIRLLARCESVEVEFLG